MTGPTVHPQAAAATAGRVSAIGEHGRLQLIRRAGRFSLTDKLPLDPGRAAPIVRQIPGEHDEPCGVSSTGRRNHKRRALYCGAGTFAVPCLNPVRLGQGAVHAYG